MSSAAIVARGLGKCYRLTDSLAGPGMLREDLARWARGLFGRSSPAEPARHKWALRGLDLEVGQGEVLGLIGHNGAGKSTLLRLLSRITAPTEGVARVRGRVGTLLEVGTGFHLELTGRENVYLAGAVLGLSRHEVNGHLDDILEMANVGDYLDVPVKRYSTGMFVRLAFAVAASLRTEVLLVDEILAVGDAQFRQRCLGSIDQAARDGRCVIFVSHNTAAVEQVCGRVAYLKDGALDYIGEPGEAIRRYYEGQPVAVSRLADRPDRQGNGQARVTQIEILDGEGRPLQTAQSGHALGLRFGYECAGPSRGGRLRLLVQVRNHFDQPVFVHDNELSGDRLTLAEHSGSLLWRLPRLPLPPSSYRLSYRLMVDGHLLDSVQDAMVLRVDPGDYYASGLLPDARDGVCLVDAGFSDER